MNVSSLILEETEDFVALNKPAGLLSIPDRAGTEISLKTLLKNRYGEIFTIHRLDRETSGVIVFAKNADSHKHLSIQFENHETEKFCSRFTCRKTGQHRCTHNGTSAQKRCDDNACKGQSIINRLQGHR